MMGFVGGFTGIRPYLWDLFTGISTHFGGFYLGISCSNRKLCHQVTLFSIRRCKSFYCRNLMTAFFEKNSDFMTRFFEKTSRFMTVFFEKICNLAVIMR